VGWQREQATITMAGWDSLAHQAATTKWRGDGTNMALVVMEGLIDAQSGLAPLPTLLL
jgi:hypothetical protein